MAQVAWLLKRERPAVEVQLVAPDSDQRQTSVLLADTGAGPTTAPFELLLDEQECIVWAHRSGGLVRLSGAYAGEFRSYIVEVNIPELGFSTLTTAVGIDRPPKGFNGIAAFRFLNRFVYGNLGQSGQFGLESFDDD